MNQPNLDVLSELKKQGKWTELLDASQSILSAYPDCRPAMRSLAASLVNLDRLEEAVDIWQTLLALNDKGNNYAYLLAKYHKEQSNIIEYNNYIKSALLSALEFRAYDEVDEICLDLLESFSSAKILLPLAASELAKNGELERAADLVIMLASAFEEKNLMLESLEYYKKAASYVPKSKELGRTLIKVYRALNAKSQNIDEFLRRAELEKTDNLEESIKRVERFLMCEPGNFIEHQSWGIGKIADLDLILNKVKVDFDKNPGHIMSLEMAVLSTRPIPKDSVQALVRTNPDMLKGLAKDDPVKLITYALNGLRGEASSPELKSILVGTVIEESAWASWWGKARGLLKTAPQIETPSAPNGRFKLRKEQRSFEDEIKEQIDEKNPADKLDVVQEYLKHIEKFPINKELADYLLESLKNSIKNLPDFLKASAIFLAEDLNKRLKNEKIQEFEPLLAELIKTASNWLPQMKIQSRLKQVLDIAGKTISETEMTKVLQSLILEADRPAKEEAYNRLAEMNNDSALADVIEQVCRFPENNPETFLWIISQRTRDRCSKYITDKYLLDKYFALLISASRSRTARLTEKQQKIVMAKSKPLLNNPSFISYLDKTLSSESDQIARDLKSKFNKISGLDKSIRSKILSVLERYAPIEKESEQTQEEAFEILITAASLERKRAEFRDITENQLIEIAKEIAVARDMGDLSENAEYITAKQKQALLSAMAEKLQSQLLRYMVVRIENVNNNKICFGTRFKIQNEETGNIEEYSLLGPEESNPTNGIISYLSPMGKLLINKRTGESVMFDFPGKSGSYKILEIAIASEHFL